MSIIEMTVTGALMILAVIVLRAVTLSRVPKRAFIIMWEIALLRLLLPVSVPVKILPAVQTVMPQISAVENAVTEPMRQEVVLRVPEEIIEYIPNSAPAAISAPKAVPNVPSFTVTPEMIWIAGMALMALFFTVSYIRGTRRFKGSKPCESEFVREWLASHQLKRPLTVKVSHAVSSPLTYGVLNPTILIPPEFEQTDERTLGFTLEHEYAHIRHFDALKKLICIAALCVHWFNPMMWVLYLLYNRDMELWCDESVIKKFGAGSRAQYARLLINIEESRSTGVPLFSHFGRSTTEERIVSIMKFKKATFITICTAVLLVAAITVTIIATSVEPVPKDPVTTGDVNVSENVPPENDSPIIVGDKPLPENGDVTWSGWAGDTESNINDHHSVLPSNFRIVISDEGKPYQFEEGEEAVVTFVLADSPKGRFEYGYQKNLSSEGDTHYDPKDVPLGGFGDSAVSFVFTAPESGKYWFYITNTTYEAVTLRTAQVSRQSRPLHTTAELYVFPGENENRYISDTLRASRQVMQAGVTNEQIHNIVTGDTSSIRMEGHHFEVGDRAIVVFDFRHPVTEEEAQMEVNYLIEQCDGDHDDGINGGEQTARYSLTNSFIYDDTCLVFTFIAPETADYYFNGGTPLDRDFYVAGVWVAVETEPYKFGSMTIGEEFFSKHTEYQWKSISSKTMTDEEFHGYLIQSVTDDTIITDVVQISGPNGEVYYITNGETLTEEEYKQRYPTPDVEWWTYDEYKAWLENEKVQLQSMLGERAWTGGRGEFVWTQEIIDEAIQRYEEILEEIKNGYLYSKTVDGSENSGVTIGYLPDNIETASEPYSVVIVLSDGEEKLIGPYERPEELAAEVKKYCSEQLANGRMTQAEYDEIMDGYEYYFMTPQERAQWREEYNKQVSDFRIAYNSYYERFKGYSRPANPATLSGDGSLYYIKNLYRDNEPADDAQNGSVYLKKGDRAIIVADFDLSCEVFANEPKTFLQRCNGMLTFGFTLDGTNYVVSISSSSGADNKRAGVDAFFKAPEDGEYSFFIRNDTDSDFNVVDCFVALQGDYDPENGIAYMTYDGFSSGIGDTGQKHKYDPLT